LTSLAPSPIASVVIPSVTFFSLIRVTSSAFYLGDTLQAITTLAVSANSSILSFIFAFFVIDVS